MKVCPLELVHERILFRHIRTYGVRPTPTCVSHGALLRLLRCMQKKEARVLTLVEWGCERNDYEDNEPIFDYDILESWTSDPARILAEMRKLKPIDDKLIDQIGFGPVVRQRGLNRFRDGCIDFSSIRMTTARHAEHGKLKLFQSNTGASQKTKSYLCRAAFSAETGAFVGSPTSLCFCEVGAYECAHLLGNVMLGRAVQRAPQMFEDLTDEKLLKFLPHTVFDVQQTLCPWDHIFGLGAEDLEHKVSRRTLKLFDAIENEEDDDIGNDESDKDEDGGKDAKTTLRVCEEQVFC